MINHKSTCTANDITFPMRLQVYLAKCDVASRRHSEKLIVAGRVAVNGRVVTELGTKVSQGDKVTVDGFSVKLQLHKVYILLNKPKGYLCAGSDSFGRRLASDLLMNDFTERLFSVGRLDLYSSGAIIFTNDGEFAKIVSHPSSEIEKEYFVETVFPFDEKILTQFTEGVNADGVFYKCKSAKKLNDKKMRITLVEGKNREIRKVLNYFNVSVQQLTRIRIGSIKLDGLPSGKFRHLTTSEIEGLLSAAKVSSKK